MSGVTTFQSGTPAERHDRRGTARTSAARSQRPNLVGAVPTLNCQPNSAGTTACARELINCFDPAAFALPAQYTFGNAPRNMLRGPEVQPTDLSLMKNVPLGGSVRLQVRAEVFNLFNTVNYGNPEHDVRRGDVRPHHLRRAHAPDAAGRETALLKPFTGYAFLFLRGTMLPRFRPGAASPRGRERP